ncbi:MAG: LptF/LptG family permease [Candidatus Zixiibacteriota bacterium]
MNRIDRYLIGRFLFNFAWSLLAFWVVFIIVDLVEQLDKFIDKGVPPSIVALYYLYFTPSVLILVAPIGVLLATLFAVGFLAKRNELLAMRAAGLSLWRLAFPFLFMGLIVTGAVFAAGETVYPQAEARRADLRSRVIKGTVQPAQFLLQNLYVSGASGRVYYFRSYNTGQNVGTGATVQTFADGRLVESIEMKSLRYSDSLWIGEGGDRRIFAAAGDSVVRFESFATRSFPQWTETPEDVVRKRVDPQQMTYRQLRETVERLRRGGAEPVEEETELALKLAFPFINFIVVLIGFPIAARTRQSGMALNFGIAMLISFVVRVLYEIFRSLGHNGEVSPLLAAWAPNLICLVAGIAVLLRVRK